jgi:hypothetical protein
MGVGGEEDAHFIFNQRSAFYFNNIDSRWVFRTEDTEFSNFDTLYDCVFENSMLLLVGSIWAKVGTLDKNSIEYFPLDLVCLHNVSFLFFM